MLPALRLLTVTVIAACATTACSGAASTGDNAAQTGGAQVYVEGETLKLPIVLSCIAPSSTADTMAVRAVLDEDDPQSGMAVLFGGGDSITIRIMMNKDTVYDAVSSVSFDGETLDWSGEMTKRAQGVANSKVTAKIHVNCP